MKKIKIFPQGDGRRARNERPRPEPSENEAADRGSRPPDAAGPAVAFGDPPRVSDPATPGPGAAGEASSSDEPDRFNGITGPGQPSGYERWAPIVIDEPIFDFEPK